MAKAKMYKVGEGITPEKDESYYNAGEISQEMSEAKMMVYNGNNLVTLGLAEDNIDKVIEGLEQIGKGSASIASSAKHFKDAMHADNHYKILIAIQDMVVTEDE